LGRVNLITAVPEGVREPSPSSLWEVSSTVRSPKSKASKPRGARVAAVGVDVPLQLRFREQPVIRRQRNLEVEALVVRLLGVEVHFKGVDPVFFDLKRWGYF